MTEIRPFLPLAAASAFFRFPPQAVVLQIGSRRILTIFRNRLVAVLQHEGPAVGCRALCGRSGGELNQRS